MKDSLFALDTDFLWRFQSAFNSPIFDHFTPFLSNPFFWVPLGVFVLVYSLSSHHDRPWMRFFFGLASFILAYQVAYLLMALVHRPAPNLLLILEGSKSAGTNLGFHFSFPDWVSCSYSAIWIYSFSSAIKKKIRKNLSFWVFILLAIGLSRMYLGYAFPLDIAAGIILGIPIGWGMAILSSKVIESLRKV